MYIYTDEFVPLLDIEGNVIARYYITTEGGDAIIENGGEVIEFDADTPLDVEKNDENLYYLGPMQIFEKNNDVLTNVQDSSEEVDFNDISIVNENFIEIAQNTKEEEVSLNKENSCEETGAEQIELGIWTDLKGGMGNTLANNTDCLKTNHSGKGNCGSTAAAIMLLYYDKYIDSGYVDDGYREQKKWQAFTDKLISYIQPNQVGANTQDIVNGVNEYLKDRGMKASCKYACENENKILVEKIRDNKPIILNLFGHPTYKDHAVVAEGYFISDVGKKYTYASINDGAGLNRYKGKRMYVNMEYAGTVVYLK